MKVLQESIPVYKASLFFLFFFFFFPEDRRGFGECFLLFWLKFYLLLLKLHDFMRAAACTDRACIAFHKSPLLVPRNT